MDELCRKLEAYHDGELSPAEVSDMETHIRSCGNCAVTLLELRELKRLGTRLQYASGCDISGSVMARLPTAAGQELRNRLWHGWWKVPAVVFATCALFILIAENNILPNAAHRAAPVLAEAAETAKLESIFSGGTLADTDKLAAIVFGGG